MQSNSTENDALTLFPLETSQKLTGKLLPTPTEHGNYNRKGASKKSGNGLATEVKQNISSPEVFPARISVLPERGPVSKDHGQVFGLPCLRLLGYYDPDTSLLKTSVPLLDGFREDLPDSHRIMRYTWKMVQGAWTLSNTKLLNPSLLTLTRSFMMRRGKIYEQRIWVRRTKGKESGLWRIPDTCQGGVKSKEFYQECKKTGKSAIRLQDQIKHEKFPTPQASDGQQGAILNENTNIIFLKSGNPRKISYQGISGSVGLSRFVQIKENFPTPTESMVTMQDMEQARYAGNDPNRPKYKEIFPTPQAWDANRGPLSEERYQKKLGGPNLISEIMHQQHGEADQVNGSLNPAWECWLMGYPLAWTDLRADYQISLIKKPVK